LIQRLIINTLKYCVRIIFFNTRNKIEKGGACSGCGGEEKHIQSLVRKPEVNRPLYRPRRRWENIIKMDFNEVGFGGMG
jgi:hypothetical protein